MGHFKLMKIIVARHLSELDGIHETVDMGIELKKPFIEGSAHFEDRIGIHGHRIINAYSCLTLRKKLPIHPYVSWHLGSQSPLSLKIDCVQSDHKYL